ncbi:MAG TPA: arylsulfotransferase family protein [Thermoleophilaceae bacterium]
MRTRRFLVALVCLAGVAALAVGVVAARQRRAVHAHVRGKVGPTATVFPASVRVLSCHLRERRFQTLAELRPTGFCVARRQGAPLAPEDILVTPRPDPKKNPGQQFGLMILSPAGKLLWYERRPDKVHDLKVVDYRGQPALAFFQKAPRGRGYYELLDRHYRPLARVRAGHGLSTNLHELQLTPQGTAYLSADVTVRVRGAGKVTEYVVEEVDVVSGRVLFDWRSLKHAGVRDSYEERPKSGAWDYFHGNSIDPPTPGDPTVLISSRNTSSVYGVDRATGRTEWILGGKRDQFHLAKDHPSWVFCGQHDVHRLPDGDIELLDNGGTFMHGEPHCPVHPARALVFRIDARNHRVRLVKSISSKPLTSSGKGFFSGWVGSARPESNGDTLIDWGGPTNRVTEVAADGREKLLLRLAFWSYRGIPASWTGLPGGRPAVVARRGRGDSVDVYASWNGATQIMRWQLLAGKRPDSLAPVGTPVPFADLETRIALRTGARYVAVRALDAAGTELGTSAAARVR